MQGEVSEEYDCSIEVRHGECLYPFLFSLFLNDLEQALIDGNFTDRDRLITRLLFQMEISVDADKIKVVVFRNGGRLSTDGNFFYGDSYMEVDNSFSYLGVLFSSSGKFTLYRLHGLKRIWQIRELRLIKLFKDT